jgi:SPX domain protein involved in polyphosphate accumulation
MKFGKRLKQQIDDTLPEWRDKFLSYKELKKLVRLISSAPLYLNRSNNDSYGKAEAEFVELLNNEIHKFNMFFVEQEEDFIIRHRELQGRIEKLRIKSSTVGDYYEEEMVRIRKTIVNFHGEMVLLESYSNINYIGLAKILKKYDKRTGKLLRLPFIQKVLQQPFFTTDLISKLVKECETTIDLVFPIHHERGGAISPLVAGEGIFRHTVVALLTMQEMRKTSSTTSHFSLPPLNLSLSDSDVIQSLHLQLNSSIPIV